MLKKFFRYYKPHIPNQDTRMIVNTPVLIFLLQCLASVANYIRIRWGHVLGVRIEYDHGSRPPRTGRSPDFAFCYHGGVRIYVLF